jgi:hypothetical protein
VSDLAHYSIAGHALVILADRKLEEKEEAKEAAMFAQRDEAAAKVQALARGYNARKQVKAGGFKPSFGAGGLETVTE